MELVCNLIDVTEVRLDAWRIGDDSKPVVSDDAYVSAWTPRLTELRYVQRSSGEVGSQRAIGVSKYDRSAVVGLCWATRCRIKA